MKDEASATLVASVRRALDRDDPNAAAEAHRAVAELARRAVAADDPEDPDYAAYHGLLWDLYADTDHRTYPLRWWLSTAGRAIEEAAIPREALPEALAPDALLARVRGVLDGGARPRHPMAVHLFEGTPTIAALRIYLRHHWHRSRLFYRELTELALSRDLGEASVIARNLYDESGGEVSAAAHPFLLQRLLRALDVADGFDDRPELVEAHAYLNNRVRCARHPNPAWGYAVLFALEYGTPANHGTIYHLLRRVGVAEEDCVFHRVHMTADVEHAAETAELIAARITAADDQAIFLAALDHHRRLRGRLFDAIWREIQERGNHD
jgi:pyrroloquinoline quinone (PQQ) biosynthesis protein C